MTEAVPLGELLHEEALTGVRTETLIPVWTLPHHHDISNSRGEATDPMVGGARSMWGVV